MALLTAPEGSDLDEFKRTRAFVMTKDEDDSSCSSSSSSSSERCVRVCLLCVAAVSVGWFALLCYCKRPVHPTLS